MAARRALAAHQRQSRRAMPAAPGDARDSPVRTLAMAVKAQVTAAPVPAPSPVTREVGSRAIVSCRPGIASARTRSRASTGTRRVHQRRMRDGAGPGQRFHLAGVPGGG